jgi:hypothetical protein
MYVVDHRDNLISVHSPDDLLARLQSVRKGPYGAFILWHGDTPDEITGPSLFVHINNDLVYLWFVAGDHPGFQPTGMSPADCPESVHFMQTDGFETAGITAQRDAVVSVDVAYKAVTEFLEEPALPASISWFEL